MSPLANWWILAPG